MLCNGVELHVEIDGVGPPLLLLHGFSGSVRAWDDARAVLRQRSTVIVVDALGHGQSDAPEDPERYTLDWAARDLLALLDALRLSTVDLLGYSMGGRTALFFAVRYPRRVSHLILESATPGLDSEVERRQRLVSDLALAERIERDGIAAFVEEWERVPLLALAPHVSDAVRHAQHQQRLRCRPRGLANSLRGLGTGRQEPLWGALPSLTMPVTLIVGQRDERYHAIGRRMAELLPDADLHALPAAGHTVHVDQPEMFTTAVTIALDKKLTQRLPRC